MGCLARFHKILIGLRVVSDDEPKESVETAATVKIDEDLGEKILREVPVAEEAGRPGDGEEEDLGVEVEKKKSKKRKQEGEVVEEKVLKSEKSIAVKPPKKKRKKKGGDAFDDLFDSLM